jgi:PAS domain S-box-containing protein
MQIHLTLSQKALALVAVPLFFELCFVGILMFTQHQLEVEYVKESEAKKASMFVNVELTTMIEGISAATMYAYNHNDRYLEQFNSSIKQLQSQKQHLSALMKSDMSADLQAFNELSDEMITTFDVVRQLRETGDQADLLRGVLRGQRLLKELGLHGAKFVDHLTAITNEQHAEQTRLREQAQLITAIGVIWSVILAVCLTVYFNYGTSRRLDVLMKNTFHLAREKPLEPLLQGFDEIAMIDRTFHEMAFALDDARLKQQALTDNAVDVICSLDDKGRFTKVNQAVEPTWGYTPDELLGLSLYTVIPENEIKQTRLATEEIIAGKSKAPVELTMRRKDQTLCEMLWTMRWSDKEKSLYCVAHDISERKKLERLKAEVVAMISHDLRSPLTGLMGIFEMLKFGALGQLNKIGEQRIASADRIVSTLVSMINDLLDIEKMESGMFELDCKTWTLHELMVRSVEMVSGNAEPRGISFLVEESKFSVYCDRERIERVLINLLDNAIKFSSDNSAISVIAKELPDAIEISVIDNGRGIAGDKLETIFERFKQTDPTDNREKKGSGLGLAICKAIVEAHHGTIGAQSNLGAGSKFWFRLPKHSS